VDCGTVLLIKMSGKRTIQDFFSLHKKQKKSEESSEEPSTSTKVTENQPPGFEILVESAETEVALVSSPQCTPDLQLESDVLSDSESDPGGDDEKSPEFNEWLLDKNKQSEKETTSRTRRYFTKCY
jgi:hypothetical protein